MSDGNVRAALRAVLGLSVRYRLIPATTGVPAVGAVVTTGAGAMGAYKDIVAAGGIATEFWICGYFVDTIAGAEITSLQHVLTTAGPAYAILGTNRINPTAVTLNFGLLPLGPYPVRMNAGAQVQCRGWGTAGKTIQVSMLYALTL